MADLASREPARVANWKEWRTGQAAKYGGRLSRHDTRRLMKELAYHWHALSWYMPASPRREEWARPVRSALNDGRVLNAMNAAQHQDSAPITPEVAQVVLETLLRTMLLIGARPEAEYVAPLYTSVRSTANAEARRQSRPGHRSAPAGTTCVGAHWVQPKIGIPGHWWWVAIRDERIIQLDVDLTTQDVAAALTRTQTPALAGLAFCFSAPAHHVLREDIGSVEALWQRCKPFSHRTAKETVEEMGRPFRLVGHGEPMRKPKTDPSAFRETEIDVHQRTGAEPSSIFDVDGTDSVGALALNGMPIIRDARQAGASVWPFDRPTTDGLTCVEIFPRSLWASLNPNEDPRSKRNRSRRAAFVEQAREEGLSLSKRTADTLTIDERAFDTFLTARALAMYGGGIDEIEILSLAHIEGQIWIPD